MVRLLDKNVLVLIDIYNAKYKETLEILIVNGFLNYYNGTSIFTHEDYTEFKRTNARLYTLIKKKFTIVHPSYFEARKYDPNLYDYVLTFGMESAKYCGLEGTSAEVVGRTFDISIKDKDLTCTTFPSIYLIYDTYRKLENGTDIMAKRRLTSTIQTGINRAHGFEPLSTYGDVRFMYSLEDVHKCIDSIKRTRYMAFDFETIPIIKGLDTKTQKKHAVDFTKSLPTVCSFSEQPDRAWLLPMYHAQSPFLVGKDTTLEIYLKGEDQQVNTYITYDQFLEYKEGSFYVVKDGSFITNYGYELFELDWDQVYNIYRNRDICIEKSYSNYLEEVIIPAFIDVFGDVDIVTIAYNAKFDYKIAAYCCKWIIYRNFEDPMMMYSTMDEVSAKSLKIISTFYYPEFQGYGEDVKYFHDPLRKLGLYAGTDTYLTLRLYLLLKFELAKAPKLYRGYYNHEAPKLCHLGELEFDGMYVDRRALHVLTQRTQIIHDELEAELLEFPVVKQYTAFRKFTSINDLITESYEQLEKERLRTLTGLKRKITKLQDAENYSRSKAKQRDVKKYTEQILIADRKDYYNSNYGYGEAGKETREQKVLARIANIKNGAHKDVFRQVNFNSSEQVGEIIYKTKLQRQIPKLLKDLKKKVDRIKDNEAELALLEKQQKYYELVQTIGLRNPWPTVQRKLTHPVTKRKYSVTEEYPSTNKNELHDIEDDTGFLEKYLRFKAVSKLLSTYMLGVAKFLDPKSKVHTSYATVDSKRLSSRAPNLQNLPSRHTDELVKGLVKDIKKCFQPRKGRIIAQIDLSQAELRIYSLLGSIMSMQQAYLDDKDIHVKTACAILGMSEEDFYKLPKDDYKMYRTWAKAANFGIIYKISADGFLRFAKISYGIVLTLEEAQEWMNAFFSLYPEIHNYHKEQIALAKRQGYVETLYGFRRNLPNIHSLNSEYRSKSERISINSPTQGTGGQMLVQSLMVAKERLIAYGYKGRFKFLNTVHDSIILEADEDVAGHVFQIVMEACNNAPNKEYYDADLFPVPMKSDIEFSRHSWGELVELGDKPCYSHTGTELNFKEIGTKPEVLRQIDFTKVTF